MDEISLNTADTNDKIIRIKALTLKYPESTNFKVGLKFVSVHT
jgi:hypothetical protein